MQLLTIGLYELNADGTSKLSGGAPIETYDQSTVTGLAKVFTGWDFDAPVAGTPDHMRRPMAFIANRHSTSSKSFLGVTMPAGSTDGPAELKTALDTLFNHPNGGPFIGRQLIQRLVTSNPTPALRGPRGGRLRQQRRRRARRPEGGAEGDPARRRSPRPPGQQQPAGACASRSGA